MGKFISKYYYLVLILITLLLSIIPDVYRIYITPKGTTFPLIHNRPEDYFGYLGYMRTGVEGEWIVTNRVSSEHFQPKFVYTLFVIGGIIGKITQIELPWIYFAARVIFGGLLLYISYITICNLYKQSRSRIIAILLVCFSTGFWYIGVDNGRIFIGQFLTFWTHFDPVARVTFLPHHLLATLLGLYSLIVLNKAITSSSKRHLIQSGFIGMLAGFNYHGAMSNIIGSIGLLLLSKKKERFYFVIYILISVTALLYIFYLSHTVWPYTISNNLAGKFTFPVRLGDYIGVLGPTFFLTIIGLRQIIFSNNELAKILLVWALFPFVGIFLVEKIFPQWGNMPYLEATSYIPFGILAVFGIQEIGNLFKTHAKSAMIIILVILMMYFIPPWVDSLSESFTAIPINFYNRYIPNQIIDGMKWLDKNSQYQSTVLSGGFFGAIIQAYSHNYTVYGDDINTYKASEKSADMIRFFAQRDPQAALEILKKYDVKYVFYSMDTDAPSVEFISKLPLTQVYTNSRVTIFQVN